MKRTLIGLQPENTVAPRPRRVYLGTPVHIPPPRRVHRRQQPLTPRGEQIVAALIICYALLLGVAITVWWPL